MLLKDKVAIITGAGSGFGRETSILFAKEGAKIVAVDMMEKGLDETVKLVEEAGGQAIGVKANVSEADQVQNFIKAAIDKYGQINILFNNAGIFRPGTVEETDDRSWQQSIEVNLNGVFYGMKYAMPYLKKTKGSIINTASAGGIIGFPQAVAYAATKGAVISLSKAVAVDYAKDGVRCNAICPGTSTTGMTKEALENPDMNKAYLDPIPMKRFGKTEDIAQAALFLASDMSDYITGLALPVDGGWTMS